MIDPLERPFGTPKPSPRGSGTGHQRLQTRRKRLWKSVTAVCDLLCYENCSKSVGLMPKLDKLPKQKQANRYIHLLKIKKSLDLRPRQKKTSPPTEKQAWKPVLGPFRGPHGLFKAPKDASETRRKDIRPPFLPKGNRSPKLKLVHPKQAKRLRHP